jgi:hypothetical protein
MEQIFDLPLEIRVVFLYNINMEGTSESKRRLLPFFCKCGYKTAYKRPCRLASFFSFFGFSNGGSFEKSQKIRQFKISQIRSAPICRSVPFCKTATQPKAIQQNEEQKPSKRLLSLDFFEDAGYNNSRTMQED